VVAGACMAADFDSMVRAFGLALAHKKRIETLVDHRKMRADLTYRMKATGNTKELTGCLENYMEVADGFVDQGKIAAHSTD
jgi:transcriptional regulator of aromatic amino acid metabolism